MRGSEIVSLISGVVGTVGGALGFATWWQAQRDRRQKETAEQAYQAFVGRIEETLRSGPGNSCTIEPGNRGWAARAVSERRLDWGELRNTVTLPETAGK